MKWSGSAWTADDDLVGASSGWVDNGTNVRMETLTDRVGIGTSSPNGYAKLQVNHTDRYAGLFYSNYLSQFTHIIHAEYNGNVGSSDITAVYGRARPNDNYGYGGFFEGGFIGVRGCVYPTGPYVYYGVYGQVNGGQGSNIGVYGHASGPGVNWAGFFDGNVKVVGSLSKGGGSFQIDHPLDPENKYLFHSFVESPDMMNVYNGNIVTDTNGDAVVKLPDYFEALNKDFRYQLTVIGDFAQAIISTKISGNKFSIKTDKPNVEVSWQVTGIRKDKWAEANRIQVEVDKPAKEKGLYLHPEAYGLGEEKFIHYEQNKEAERKMPESEKN